jgi:hypothetical protein
MAALIGAGSAYRRLYMWAQIRLEIIDMRTCNLGYFGYIKMVEIIMITWDMHR